MEDAEAILASIETDLNSVRQDLVQFSGESTPSIETIRQMFEKHRDSIFDWAQRAVTRKADEPALVRLRSATIELLLWESHSRAEVEKDRNKLLLGLWNCLSESISYQAKSLARGRGKAGYDVDRFDDLMQEGFLYFSGMIEKFKPDNNTMLRTFIQTCYRNRFINIVKKLDREPEAAKAPEMLDKMDPRYLDLYEEAVASEQLEQIEQALERMASQSEEDATRVQAFRLFKLHRKKVDEICLILGQSQGWVSKWVNRIELQLKEEMQAELRTRDK
jgi:RNA polymerase sigma factor (sigma-70 family)